MKSTLFCKIIILFVCIQVYGQSPNFECGTDRAHQSLMQTDSTYRAGFYLHQQDLSYMIQQQAANNSSRAVVTIPVVVHVIHLGEAVGLGTNIPDSIIHGAIQGINDRFGGVIGNGSINTELQFCLASRDPNGYSTTGIVRKNGLMNIPNYANGVTQYPDTCLQSGISLADQLSVKNLSRWPSLDYYNIWVVNSICRSQLYGFAQFPNASSTTAFNDGLVIDYLHFKYIDCSATHEMGHGFDLFHTFEGDNNNTRCPSDIFPSIQGDKCDDTPPHKKSDYQTNTCVNGNWDNSKYNYMSYTFVNTPTISYGKFTPKQKDRITASLNTSPRSYLRNSLGCTQGACLSPNNDECMGNYAAVPLSFGSLCNPISKSTCGATASGFSNCQGTQDDDVFFSFAPNTSTATITVTSSAGFDAVFQVLSGPCGSSMAQLTNGCVNSTGTGGTETVTLTGLSTTSTYFIRVWHNGTGYGTTGNFTICAYGSSTTTCAIPSGPTESNKTQTTVNLSWNSVASATNYTVQYKVINTSTWTTVNAQTNFYPLSGLSCYTSYVWHVMANCSSGNTLYSYVRIFTTDTCGTTCITPTVSIFPSNVNICSGGSGTTLNAIGNAQSYIWSPSSGLSTTRGQTVTANPTLSTTYTVTASNGSCTATASALVTISSKLSASVHPSSPIICGYGTTSVSVSSGSAYAWSGPSGFSASSQTVSVSNPGGYAVTVTNPGGCNGSVIVGFVVNRNPTLIAYAGLDKFIPSGTSVIIGAPQIASGGSQPYAYSWTPETFLNNSTVANPISTPTNTISYTLLVTDNKGCTATDNVLINVPTSINNDDLNNNISIYPNPNNGTFRVVAKTMTQKEVQLKLFSAIGQLIYSEQPLPLAYKIEKDISLSNISSGIYLLQITVNNEATYMKLIVE